MHIGVFGDSYAEKNCSGTIWWKSLRDDYLHDVECFGEGGSSILFSARMIMDLAQKFDLVIWCVTALGRFSLPKKDGSYCHMSPTYITDNSDAEIDWKKKICIDYYLHIVENSDDVLINKGLISYICSEKNNIMIIPCFPDPLKQNFNLKDINVMEIQHFLPGWDLPKFYQHYFDRRDGHLTPTNHRILAQEINQNLSPGIFQTSLDKFQKPTEKFEILFGTLS